MKKIFLLLVIIFYCISCIAEDNSIDSLYKILNKYKNNDTAFIKTKIAIGETESIFRISYWDSLITDCNYLLKKYSDTVYQKVFIACKAQSLNNIGFLKDNEGHPRSAIEYYLKSLALQRQIKDLKGEAITLNNLASSYYEIGENEKAIKYFTQSLKIQELINDKAGMAYTLNNIGGIYDNQGDVSKALEFYLRSLKLNEELNDNQGMVHALNNIGTIYDNQNDLVKALEYHQKCLSIREKINDQKGIANSLNNIANILKKQKKIKEALQYYLNAKKIQEQIHDNNLALTLKNIGNLYIAFGDPDCNKSPQICKEQGIKKAIGYFTTGLQLAVSRENKTALAYLYNGLADAYYSLNNYSQALEYGLKSLSIAQELGYPENIKVAAKTLKQIYFKQNNPKKALEMYELYVAMKDSIENEQTRKAAKSQEYKYQYEKREAQLKFEQDKRNALAAEARRKQQIVLTAMVIVLLIVVVFSIFMYNRYKLTQQQKQIIEKQKEEVENQREVAEHRRILAEEQKHIIEEKNKEITDSITYASRIQQAMLTSQDYIKNYLGQNFFIYYMPKDIVSGDFYWATYHKNIFYLITADCTGHGVPGAFMSLLNMSFLQEIIVEKNIVKPAEILNEQRNKIIKALNPTGTENSKDGMDCVLIALDIQNKILNFAAANNPLYLVRNNELIEYKPDKMPVGLSGQESKSFTNFEVQLQAGDTIYTFTDGYADQFGGPKGKKFLYKQLKELLLSISDKSTEEQKNILASVMNDWKKDVEQIDDILVIGIKI
jgi:serine phosphatase RsbU (regulator of sigma subunit)